MSVSRETEARLQTWLALLHKWQPHVNLVSAETLAADPWERHVQDSLQLLEVVGTPSGPLYDLGSGAGLPGLILAAAGIPDVHLVEIDGRKAAFLREAARLMGIPVTIHVERTERLTADPPAAIITARGFAPLPRLLEFSAHLAGPDTRYVLLKGREAESELTAAKSVAHFEARTLPSRVEPDGTIVILEAVQLK